MVGDVDWSADQPVVRVDLLCATGSTLSAGYLGNKGHSGSIALSEAWVHLMETPLLGGLWAQDHLKEARLLRGSQAPPLHWKFGVHLKENCAVRYYYLGVIFLHQDHHILQQVCKPPFIPWARLRLTLFRGYH